MKNNLMEISKKFQQVKSINLPGGIKSEDFETLILESIIDDLLSELGEIERYDDVKLALSNMFFLGKLSK